ncbi:AAA family ATPase [Desulfobacterales bacterium HSG16]|nr:AAA family ATPase [Desulfobacterales bacterium HSG16]
MQQPWTLHVRDFGRIKTADIEIAPMMLFIGPNNTGKSYLASLLWGILNYRDILPYEDITSSEYYKKCKELFLSLYENKNKSLDDEFIVSVVCWFNENLKKWKDEIIRNTFTSYDLKIGELSIELKKGSISTPSIEWRESTGFKGFDGSCFLYTKLMKAEDLKDSAIYQCIVKLAKFLLFEKFFSPIYLPASRTGFMLSYKTLTAALMEGWGLKKRKPIDFSQPIIDFLQNLTFVNMNDKNSPSARRIIMPITKDFPFENNKKHPSSDNYAYIARSLEDEILEGRIEQSEEPMSSFSYKPVMTRNRSLPFHLTSSLVTELAPLVIFLKGKYDLNALIFEEPESHLHLNAQRILAKYLVKLLNNDLPVWITTHSDIFFQQINNLIASNPDRKAKLKQASYKDDEMIKFDDIKAYQFNIDKADGMTEVVPLEQTEDGFVAPTFNQTIFELSKETSNLMTDSDDVE